MRLKDFERYTGYDAKIELQAATDGQRRFKGIIDDVVEEIIHLDTAQGVVALPFNEIASAKLILTDELIAEHMAAEAAAGQQAASE